MKIKVTEDNRERIIDELTKIQKGCRARTLGVTDIFEAVGKLERMYTTIPKKYRVGIEYVVDIHAQQFPNCYKGTPESTQFGLRYCSTGWFIVGIFRNKTKYNSNRVYEAFNIPEATKDYICKQALEKFARWGR